MQTVHAHFDGDVVRFDEPLPLQKNNRLLVTLREKKQPEEKKYPGFTYDQMQQITGIFELGGNALKDTERLYE